MSRRDGALVDALAAHGRPLPGDPTRLLVPEPVIKEELRRLGVRVPKGVTAVDARGAARAARRLQPPLALKAWGPGLVHKSEAGGVRLDLEADAIEAAAHAMADTLARHGVPPAGFLVEEQHHGDGVELLVGVARRPPFGLLVTLGAGGVLAEALARTVTRCVPLTADDALGMVSAFPAPALLDGSRGRAAVDRQAIVEVLLALAGIDGLAAMLEPQLAEVECNPVRASATGVIALDARLVLLAEPVVTDDPPATDFAPLFAPRSVAVAGASTAKVTFGNRFLAAYRGAGWTDHLYAIHPHADAVDGVPAFATVGDVPGGEVDYLLVAVPASRCADLVAASAGRVRFAHVISGGFGEAGPSGASLERELRGTARRAGIRVLGPNCLGVFAPAGRQAFQLDAPTVAGAVSVISQSGALAGDIVKAGDRRGIRFSKLVTIGNAVDVTAGELLACLVDDPGTAVIGLYLEGPREGARIVDALRRARGRKPVTILAAGASRQGAAAAVSHTGAMASDHDAWSAVGASTGATIVATLDDLLATLAFAQRYAGAVLDHDDGVLVVGPGGGASVLAADACDRHGMVLTPLAPELQVYLRELGYGAGTSVVNPLEIPVGPASGPDAFERVLEPVLATQPFADVLLHVNVQSYFSYGASGAAPLVHLLDHLATGGPLGARIALVVRNLDCAPLPDGATIHDVLTEAGLPYFGSFDEAALAIASAQSFARARRSLPSH